MNGIEKIIARIEAESDAEIAVIRAEADTAIAELEAGYNAIAESEYAKIVAAGTTEAEQASERAVSSAAMKAKQLILAAKQELVAEVFARAEAKLIALPEDRYVELLAKLSANASITGSESLIFNAKDKSDIGAKVAAAANELLSANGKTAALTLSAETREISGGVIISDGSVEANCSVEALLNQRRNELSVLTAKLLFG